MAGAEEGDLELGEGGSSGQELGVEDSRDDDYEIGEAWDEIGGSDGGEVDIGKQAAATTNSA